MTRKVDQKKRELDDVIKYQGARLREARKHDSYDNGFYADVFSCPGYLWKATEKHVISVNNLERRAGRLQMLDLIGVGVRRCTIDGCLYCQTATNL